MMSNIVIYVTMCGICFKVAETLLNINKHLKNYKYWRKMYILLFFSQEVIALFIFSLLWGRQCRLIFLFKEAKEAKGTGKPRGRFFWLNQSDQGQLGGRFSWLVLILNLILKSFRFFLLIFRLSEPIAWSNSLFHRVHKAFYNKLPENQIQV